jgi:hypothetical protein
MDVMERAAASRAGFGHVQGFAYLKVHGFIGRIVHDARERSDLGIGKFFTLDFVQRVPFLHLLDQVISQGFGSFEFHVI